MQDAFTLESVQNGVNMAHVPSIVWALLLTAVFAAAAWFVRMARTLVSVRTQVKLSLARYAVVAVFTCLLGCGKASAVQRLERPPRLARWPSGGRRRLLAHH